MRSIPGNGRVVLFLSALVSSAVTATPPGPASADPECRSSDEITVVRTDDRNHRSFVVRPPTTVESQKSLADVVARAEALIAHCRPQWGSDWRLSVFSEEKYAGYKDEPQILPYVRDGHWAESYLAECSVKDRRCVTYPLLPNQRRTWTINPAPH